jgi:hypothetical protein
MPPWPPVKARTYKNGLNLSPSRAAGLMSALPPKADIAPNMRELFFLSSPIRLFVHVAQLRASAEPAAERRYGWNVAR